MDDLVEWLPSMHEARDPNTVTHALKVEINVCKARNSEVRPGACDIQGHLWLFILG